MAFVDVPPVPPERIICSIVAAAKYQVPANIVLAVAEKEGGKPGLWVKNRNGTFDVGVMQFNTRFLDDLKPYGITADAVSQDNCYAFDLAAWRLRGHLQHDKDDVWTRAANYHSRTPKYNQIYRADLMKKAAVWGRWLDARFTTYAVTTPGVSPLKNVMVPVSVNQPVVHRIKPASTPHYNPQAADALAAVFAPNLLRGLS